MLRHALRIVLALALGFVPALAHAELWRWVDDTGVTHFTTDRDTIPRRFRDEAIAIGELPSERPAAPRAAAPLPAVAPVEPADPLAPSEPLAPAERGTSYETSTPDESIPSVTPTPAPALAAPPTSEPAISEPTTEPATTEPPTSTPLTVAPAPSAEPQRSAEPEAHVAPEATETPAAVTPPLFPGPPPAHAISPDDPRAGEVAQLEQQIASDREKLRQMISTKRWDSAELASDPEIREIAERLPRLQAQLAALQAEPAP